MPTLTLELSEAAYRAALRFAPADRERVVADALLSADPDTRADFAASLPSGSVPPKTANPETLARLRAQAAATAAKMDAMYAQWASEVTDPEAENAAFEEHMRNINANRAATGERMIY